MSDEQTEQERDAATLAQYHAWLPEYHALTEHDWTPETDERGGELYEFIVEGSGGIIAAALRELDRLTAERDAARAELARLRDRLTKLADENEAIGRNHDFFVGSPAHAACAITWGIAGLELRKALGKDGN